MVHYSRLTELYEPLRFLWCMCFEAKHLYFKKLANVVRSFTNIEFTLGKCHQLRQSWELYSSDYLKESISVTGCRSVVFSLVNKTVRNKIKSHFRETIINGTELVDKCYGFVEDSIELKVDDVFVVSLIETEKNSFLLFIYHR